MKKFLTIAATAGVLSAFAGAAQAQVVNFPGTVTPSCTLTTSNDGVLTETATPATVLATTTAGKVKLVCNSGTSKVDLTQGASVIPSQPSAPTVAFGFVGGASGGTGIFNALTAGSASSGIATDVTAAAGDTADISASITATGGKLLKVGTTYKVIVNAAVTP